MKQAKHQKTNTAWFYFHAVPRIGKFRDSVGQDYQGLQGKEEGRVLFNGHRVVVGDDEKGLGTDSGDGYPAWWMYLMPLNSVLTNG